MKKLTGLLCVGILSGICGCAFANDGVAAGNVDRVDDKNVVAPLTGTTEGMAQEKSNKTRKTVTQQLLDLLHDSGEIDDRTYDRLRQQAEEEANPNGENSTSASCSRSRPRCAYHLAKSTASLTSASASAKVLRAS